MPVNCFFRYVLCTCGRIPNLQHMWLCGEDSCRITAMGEFIEMVWNKHSELNNASQVVGVVKSWYFHLLASRKNSRSLGIFVLLQPRSSSWVVALLSILRVVFIPLLLLCNAQPRHHLPVVMNSDLYYILIIVLFALSNGYLANITLICVPK
jgi:hypothetical protein